MKKKNNDIGLEIKGPKGVCDSKECPWHGYLKVRGRIFNGKVVSTKALNTAIIEWDYYNYVGKYERYERKKTKIAAHNPSCMDVSVGDIVKIVECRPISKSKSFVIVSKVIS